MVRCEALGGVQVPADEDRRGAEDGPEEYVAINPAVGLSEGKKTGAMTPAR